MKPKSYIRVVYAKGKLLLIGFLAILIIFAVFYQLRIYFLPKTPIKIDNAVIFQLKKIFSPQLLLPTPSATPPNNKEAAAPFTKEEEEKIIAEIQSLPISEVQRRLEEKAPEELQSLIKQGAVSEAMMRELLVVMSNF